MGTNNVFVWGGCSSEGGAVAHQSESQLFNSSFPRPQVKVSLGKTLNPTLPSVYESVYEWVESP